MHYIEQQLAELKAEFAKRRKRQLLATLPIVAVFVVAMILRRDEDVSFLGLPTSVILGVVFALVLGSVAFSLWNWRCPACNKYLGKGSARPSARSAGSRSSRGRDGEQVSRRYAGQAPSFYERLLEDPAMRTSCTRVLMLMALFALFTVAAGSAQTVQTAKAPEVPTKAEFLAMLAGDLSAAPGGEALPPSPALRSTVCTSNADCPPDQLCCYPCGIPDCNWVCMTPWRKGMCPPIA